MDILESIMLWFWKNVEKGDNKRIASQTPTPGVTQELDIPYIDDGERAHFLDVYYPENVKKPLPVIIDIHGGGWMYGYKEINKYYCLYIASLGYTVFSINYRLVPDVTVAGQLCDVADAFKWIGEHLDAFPCDKENVFLTGDSAGGQLAAYSAVLNTSENLRALFGASASALSFNALGLTSPVCFIDGDDLIGSVLSPVLGKDIKYKPYCKMINIDKVIDMGVMPPSFLVTSTGDFIARNQTKKLYELLCEKGIECDMTDWPKTDGENLPHVFAVVDPYSRVSRECIDEMLLFFGKYMR